MASWHHGFEAVFGGGVFRLFTFPHFPTPFADPQKHFHATLYAAPARSRTMVLMHTCVPGYPGDTHQHSRLGMRRDLDIPTATVRDQTLVSVAGWRLSRLLLRAFIDVALCPTP
eukprot:3123796-Rhodomonas_salina.1